MNPNLGTIPYLKKVSIKAKGVMLLRSFNNETHISPNPKEVLYLNKILYNVGAFVISQKMVLLALKKYLRNETGACIL